MKCSACGAENPDGNEFCGECGTALQPVSSPAVAQNAEAVPPAPGVPAAPAPVAAPQYAAPAAAPQYAAAPAAAPKKKLTGPIVAIAAGLVLLLLLSCCIGGYLLLRKKPVETEKTETNTEIVVKPEVGRGEIVISKEKGFPTAMDALADVADQFYQGKDWWYVVVTEEDNRVEYYITPDETTYDKGVVIELTDSEWFSTDVYTVDMSKVNIEKTEPTGDEDITPEAWAAWTVNEFMVAIQEGRMDDAYDLTAPPLSDLDITQLPTDWKDIEYIGAESTEEGDVVVIFVITWEDNSTENVGALVIPGDDGWYVSDMGSADQ